MKNRDPRKAVLITAQMKHDTAWRDVAIRNVSSHGVMIQLPDPPQRGSYVELRRDALVIVGRVVWSKAGSCGLRTHEALSLPALGDLEATRPGVHPGEPAHVDRHKRARTPEEIAESAATASRRLQFALTGLACAIAVCALAFVAFHWLATPTKIIAAALG